MSVFVWWLVVVAALIGHFGLNLAIYNRINALGWRRRTIKRLTKAFFVFTVLFPFVILVWQFDLVVDLLSGRPNQVPIPGWLQVYSLLCLSTWIWLGLPWLLWRPVLGLEWIDAPRDFEVIAVDESVDSDLPLSLRCRLHARIPMNQIFELAVETIDLPIVGLPDALDGYRIAQLSDVHLTGHVHPDFTSYVVQRATDWGPDMIALTGDIIDSEPCIDWLEGIFGSAKARDGCFYVLGNHDTRIVDSQKTRQAMQDAGWTDVGGRTLDVVIRDVPSTVIGNEYPWFQRPKIPADSDGRFRLLLSHSPDQIWWARKHDVNLMLAGHTHGGQGRLPLIGPLLSPSFHGSRYASGDFYKAPTTMHVTRGLSGTHLLRINCRPELSLLTLRTKRR